MSSCACRECAERGVFTAEERRDRRHREVDDQVAMGSFVTHLIHDDGPGGAFAYTVGLHNHGQPELIAFHPGPEIAATIVQQVGHQLVAGRPLDGSADDLPVAHDFHPDGLVPGRSVEVDERHASVFMTRTRGYHGWHVPSRQLRFCPMETPAGDLFEQRYHWWQPHLDRDHPYPVMFSTPEDGPTAVVTCPLTLWREAVPIERLDGGTARVLRTSVLDPTVSRGATVRLDGDDVDEVLEHGVLALRFGAPPLPRMDDDQRAAWMVLAEARSASLPTGTHHVVELERPGAAERLDAVSALNDVMWFDFHPLERLAEQEGDA